MTARAVAISAGAVAAGWHIGPAATWLPPIRAALWPRLTSPMAPGSVAVTFDDGPHPSGTPAVLDELDRLGWAATFFVLGAQVRRHPDIVRETLARGHQVGLHGDEHRYLILRTPAATYADLQRGVETMTELTGFSPRWWRPPYGVLSGAGVVTARRLRVRPVLWSAWGRDWRADATPESVATTVASGSLDGGTVLLHDSDGTSAPDSWRRTVAALPLIAEHVHALGLTVQPLPSDTAQLFGAVKGMLASPPGS